MNDEFRDQFNRSFKNFKIAYWTTIIIWLCIVIAVFSVAVHFIAKVW